MAITLQCPLLLRIAIITGILYPVSFCQLACQKFASAKPLVVCHSIELSLRIVRLLVEII